MIIDANDCDDGTVFKADICIVGGGIAGIALALRLNGTGRSVLVLESGGENTDEATQNLCAGEVADARLHSPVDRYRQRRLGGTSGIWGGRCVPFDEIDFEKRPWVWGSGWPFGIDELLPFYPEANRLCEAGRFAYNAAEAFPAAGAATVSTQPIRGFVGRRFTDDTLERFSCPTDFGRRYRGRLAASNNVRVLLHATTTEISTLATTGAVEHLTVQTLRGRTFTAHACVFVLATGGLETPRLLLASRDHHAAGLGNSNDWVGRTYMCHIAGTLGEIRTAEPDAISHGYEMAQEGIYCRRRFALTAAAQRDLKISNFVARLHHPRIPDPSHRTGALSALYLAKPFIGFEYSKRLHGGEKLSAIDVARHVRNVVADPLGTSGFLLHWARRRTLAERKFPSVIVRPRAGVYSLEFYAEQEPNVASRIGLLPVRDRLGMQRIRVDWRHSPADMRTVREGVAALAGDLSASGCGQLLYDPEEVEMQALRDGAYGGHHIGTTRMASSAAGGVVDANCRVHGVTNLFVAGSAVFPTSSQANPTLTIVAMALRLADCLLLEIRPSAQVVRPAMQMADAAPSGTIRAQLCNEALAEGG